jgi:hypothetical protein
VLIETNVPIAVQHSTPMAMIYAGSINACLRRAAAIADGGRSASASSA